MRSYGGRLRWLISGLALFWLCSGSAYAAATVGIVTSNANPVAGGAAFSYTVTITNNAVAASNVRASLPMPSGARMTDAPPAMALSTRLPSFTSATTWPSPSVAE